MLLLYKKNVGRFGSTFINIHKEFLYFDDFSSSGIDISRILHVFKYTTIGFVLCTIYLPVRVYITYCNFANELRDKCAIV